MHLLTGQIMSGKQALSPLDMYESYAYNCALNTRGVLPTRQASKFLRPLNDSICRLDSSLCLADYHFLHSQGPWYENKKQPLPDFILFRLIAPQIAEKSLHHVAMVALKKWIRTVLRLKSLRSVVT